MILERFDPIALRVERVGPFDQEYHLDFMETIDVEAQDRRPVRLFLLASQNARGKTTLLEAFALAMSLLGDTIPSFTMKEDVVHRDGRIQLDVRVTVTFDKNIRADLILSLIAGGMIYDYLPEELEELNAPNGQETIISTSDFKKVSSEGKIANELLYAIKRGEDWSFQGLFNENLKLPTALFFTAERSISRPPSDEIVIARPHNLNFQPCHVFSREEGNWRNSLDNLLCWFAWLSEDGGVSEASYFRKACNIVNDFVIDEMDKRLKLLNRDPPEPYIEASGKYHRLDRLSSGERNRLQLILRAASLMTAHTILIIDELDLHLHPIWQHRLLDNLIRLIRRYPGLRIYYTTHSKELVERGINLTSKRNEGLIASHKIIEQPS